MKQKTASEHFREKFGCKVYKLSLDGGMTCPNRDGTKGTGGCIYCSASGSGEFAEKLCGDIAFQIEKAKQRVKAKNKGGKYIAYFQSFSNTYAPKEYLKKLFYSAIEAEDIVGLSVATRPDCLPDEIIDLLDEINRLKPVIVELGFQTSNEATAEYIRRGYSNNEFLSAVGRLKSRGIEVVAHMIIGLPDETREDAIRTARFISESGADGIKFHLLHILKGTDLFKEYAEGRVKVLSLEEYTGILIDCIAELREDMVVHRLTGDGAKRGLVAPLWSADKKRVLNYIMKRI
ncbi:MAG: TIGR01212 family radical SAM protein [Clostridia bacterium]|nr:TIGR01212 family radical SAM protein [Clostridia bacterium]